MGKPRFCHADHLKHHQLEEEVLILIHAQQKQPYTKPPITPKTSPVKHSPPEKGSLRKSPQTTQPVVESLES